LKEDDAIDFWYLKTVLYGTVSIIFTGGIQYSVFSTILRAIYICFDPVKKRMFSFLGRMNTFKRRCSELLLKNILIVKLI
jgi:hypothetical protein